MKNTYTTLDVLYEVADERRRQVDKWGEQSLRDVNPACAEVARKFYGTNADLYKRQNDLADEPAWSGVLLEEVYEALAEEDPAKLRAELVQVAAVAVSWIEDIDRKAGEQ